MTDGRKMKKIVKIRNIIKIKHSESNNYISIETSDFNSEIFETLRKEEVILYLNRKMRKLGKNFQIISNKGVMGQSPSIITKDLPFDPSALKKYKPYLQETFS